MPLHAAGFVVNCFENQSTGFLDLLLQFNHPPTQHGAELFCPLVKSVLQPVENR